MWLLNITLLVAVSITSLCEFLQQSMVSASTYKVIYNIYTKVKSLPLFSSFPFHKFLCFLRLYKLPFFFVLLLTLTHCYHSFPFLNSFFYHFRFSIFFASPIFTVSVVPSPLHPSILGNYLFIVLHWNIHTKTLNHIGHYL